MSDRLSGSCLCGACSFTAIPAPEGGVCHCSMCRKWSGGMFMATSVGDTLEFKDGSPVKIYVSSDWGRRLFCEVCGSTLAWQVADGSQSAVSVQAFDDPGQFPIVSEIFIDDKPQSYALAGETKKMTGAEVMAMYTQQPEEAK